VLQISANTLVSVCIFGQSYPAKSRGMQRELVYDPTETLEQLRTPTLALFGVLDRNVDVANAPTLFRSDFTRSGMRDFTIRIYRDAGHTLKVSVTGFNGEPSQPERLTAGYLQVMIHWSRQRGLLAAIDSSPRLSQSN
jgi:hypothetical protein